MERCSSKIPSPPEPPKTRVVNESLPAQWVIPCVFVALCGAVVCGWVWYKIFEHVFNG